MEEWIKVSGKTVEDAILEASIQLGTSREHIEVDVLERETKGFLGIGSRPAVIRARKAEEEPDIISEVFSEEKPKQPVKKETVSRQAKPKSSDAAAPEKQKNKEQSEAEVKPAKTAKPEKPEKLKKEARPQPVKKPEVQPEKEAKEEKVEKAEKREPADPKEALERAEHFLQDMFSAMGMNVKMDASCSEDTMNINLSGEDMGILIGKRGQTLDSIQYLTSLVVNKGKASYVRVKVDTEDYRERRKVTLENLAKNISFKVKKTGRPVYLEPMNPYERRIIHSALQNDPYVTTHSEGEEPNRKVVVTLKKRKTVE